MGLFNDDMTGLAAAYASMNDGKYLLTNADKAGNTPAWQNRYKINETTGQMLYEMADHLKESYEEELIARLDETLAELARLDEGKIPAGLQAYIDKKKGGKKEKEEENGKDHGGSKGSKPDFLDLDKDGDKKEPMKKAAKEKKEETEYNYVEEYLNELKLSPKEKEGLNKSVKAAVSKASAKVGLNKPEAMRFEPKEEFIKSGIFTEEEITKFLWVEFDEGYQRNPEADPQNKPYKEKSKAERMADPERGINSPAFKKFMASQGM